MSQSHGTNRITSLQIPSNVSTDINPSAPPVQPAVSNPKEVKDPSGQLRVVKQLPWLGESDRENALREARRGERRPRAWWIGGCSSLEF